MFTKWIDWEPETTLIHKDYDRYSWDRVSPTELSSALWIEFFNGKGESRRTHSFLCFFFRANIICRNFHHYAVMPFGSKSLPCTFEGLTVFSWVGRLATLKAAPTGAEGQVWANTIRPFMGLCVASLKGMIRMSWDFEGGGDFTLSFILKWNNISIAGVMLKSMPVGFRSFCSTVGELTIFYITGRGITAASCVRNGSGVEQH